MNDDPPARGMARYHDPHRADIARELARREATRNRPQPTGWRRAAVLVSSFGTMAAVIVGLIGRALRWW